MQTPKRKPGKYVGLKLDPNITEEKHKELKAKLEKLKKIQLPAISEVKRLALMGDFSENVAYQMAKGRLRGINQGILDIEDHLKRAEIIKSPKDKTKVQIGHKVTVKVNDKEKTYLILGSSETSPKDNVISHNSPLGSALIGKRVGDLVEIKTAKSQAVYKILKIA